LSNPFIKINKKIKRRKENRRKNKNKKGFEKFMKIKKYGIKSMASSKKK
jgi:hypothetical protein